MSKIIESFQEADNLMWDILFFLIDCGGPYTEVTGELMQLILESLASGLYVWEPDKYFACYWRIQPEDIKGIQERIKPIDTINGSIVYIVEMGNKEGRKGITSLTKKLRQDNSHCKGVCWHRGMKDKFYYFPKQEGVD